MNLANILPELKLKLIDLIDDKSLFILTKVCKELREFVFDNEELELRYAEFNKLYLSVAKIIHHRFLYFRRINVRIYVNEFPVILGTLEGCRYLADFDKKYICYNIDCKKALNSIESIVLLCNYEFSLKNIDIDGEPLELDYYTDLSNKPKWFSAYLLDNV